jgi:hypothetical protein
LKKEINVDTLFHSIIVFSRRCTLKKLSVGGTDAIVIKRPKLKKIVTSVMDSVGAICLSDAEIQEIFDHLYSYSQTSDEDKALHVLRINNKFKKSQLQQHSEPQESRENTQNVCNVNIKATSEANITIIAETQVPTEPQAPIENSEITEEKTIELPQEELSTITDQASETNPDIEIASNNVQTENLSQVQVSETKLCPKCGSTLILRKATKGQYIGRQFYGCSNYPKCKYIESYNETDHTITQTNTSV